MLYFTFGKDWHISSCLTDYRRRATDDDGRQLIAIGHMSISVYLKYEMVDYSEFCIGYSNAHYSYKILISVGKSFKVLF